MTGRKHQSIAVGIFCIYLASVLFLCFGRFQGNDDIPKLILGIPTDKIVHFLLFLPFPVLMTAAFTGSKPWKTLCFAIMAAIASALAIELLQGIVTDYRSTEILDLAANLCGIIAGSLISSSIIKHYE